MDPMDPRAGRGGANALKRAREESEIDARTRADDAARLRALKRLVLVEALSTPAGVALPSPPACTFAPDSIDADTLRPRVESARAVQDVRARLRECIARMEKVRALAAQARDAGAAAAAAAESESESEEQAKARAQAVDAAELRKVVALEADAADTEDVLCNLELRLSAALSNFVYDAAARVDAAAVDAWLVPLQHAFERAAALVRTPCTAAVLRWGHDGLETQDVCAANVRVCGLPTHVRTNAVEAELTVVFTVEATEGASRARDFCADAFSNELARAVSCELTLSNPALLGRPEASVVPLRGGTAAAGVRVSVGGGGESDALNVEAVRVWDERVARDSVRAFARARTRVHRYSGTLLPFAIASSQCEAPRDDGLTLYNMSSFFSYRTRDAIVVNSVSTVSSVGWKLVIPTPVDAVTAGTGPLLCACSDAVDEDCALLVAYDAPIEGAPAVQEQVLARLGGLARGGEAVLWRHTLGTGHCAQGLATCAHDAAVVLRGGELRVFSVSDGRQLGPALALDALFGGATEGDATMAASEGSGLVLVAAAVASRTGSTRTTMIARAQWTGTALQRSSEDAVPLADNNEFAPSRVMTLVPPAVGKRVEHLVVLSTHTSGNARRAALFVYALPSVTGLPFVYSLAHVDAYYSSRGQELRDDKIQLRASVFGDVLCLSGWGPPQLTPRHHSRWLEAIAWPLRGMPELD